MSNYPPGVTENNLPGNRPDDVLYDQVEQAVEYTFIQAGMVHAIEDVEKAFHLVKREGYTVGEAAERVLNDALLDLEAYYLSEMEDEE